MFLQYFWTLSSLAFLPAALHAMLFSFSLPDNPYIRPHTAKTWKQNSPVKLKFSFKEAREYETIDDDIASLEEQLEKLEQDILKNATNSVKLSELVQQKEETQAALDEKMERWVYLSDLAEKIESQKNGQPV